MCRRSKQTKQNKKSAPWHIAINNAVLLVYEKKLKGMMGGMSGI
jgi:hypothetical protein